MRQIKAFIAGFVSTLLFHQGLLGVFFLLGIFPRAPFNMTPVPPLQIPQVLSLAFWGGLWGIALWWMIRRSRGATWWALAIVLGAVLPSAVALFVVMPLKGMAVAGGWDPKLIVGALLLNGAWGLGVALILKFWKAGA